MTSLEKKRERDRAYYQRHREERLEYRRQWEKDNDVKRYSYKKDAVTISSVRAARKMEDCIRLLSEAACKVRNADDYAVLRRCIDDISAICTKVITTVN